MKLLFILGAILQLVADFQQVKESQMMMEPQISTGTLTYRAPDYLRWEYKTPTQLVWELDANKSNVSPQIQRLLKMIMLTIAADNFENSTDFSVRVEEGIYHLTPKNREIKQFFSLIQIEIDSTNGIAKQVTLIEKSGDISTITFYNICL